MPSAKHDTQISVFEAIAVAFGETGRKWRIGDTETMHVVAKSAKRDAEDAEDAGLAWWYR